MIADAGALKMASGGGNEDLDATIVRRLDELRDVVSRKPGPPSWLLPLAMYLIGQLVGSVWWAATMQSNVSFLTNENMKLWQKVETHDLQLGRLDGMIRTAVKEAMADANYVRVGKGN